MKGVLNEGTCSEEKLLTSLNHSKSTHWLAEQLAKVLFTHVAAQYEQWILSLSF